MLSAAVGAFSASKEIGTNLKKNGTENEELRDHEQQKDNNKFEDVHEGAEVINGQHEDHGDCNGKQHEEEEVEHDDDDDDDGKLNAEKALDLGPQFSLKEQLEKDKDDESLRRWKEQLLGSVDISAVGESKEAEVKIVSISVVSPGRPDMVMPIPFDSKAKPKAFTLREGSRYRLKFTFTVSNNIVSGLKYINTVWKARIRVDNTKLMLGTFSPRSEPYTYELEEETTPSGLFARGSYSARTKFVDDDDKVYLDVSYLFDIQKNWPSCP